MQKETMRLLEGKVVGTRGNYGIHYFTMNTPIDILWKFYPYSDKVKEVKTHEFSLNALGIDIIIKDMKKLSYAFFTV